MPPPRVCPRCHKQNPSASLHCSHCGAVLIGIGGAMPWDTRVPATVQGTRPSGRPVLVLALVGMVAAIGAGVFFARPLPPAPPVPAPRIATPAPVPQIPPPVPVVAPQIQPPVAQDPLIEALPDDVRKVLARRDALLHACAEQALRKHPDLAGDVWVSFDVQADGRLANLEVQDPVAGTETSTSLAVAMAPCLQKRLKTLLFPATDGVRHVKFPIQPVRSR
jgi:hypothetical protein